MNRMLARPEFVHDGDALAGVRRAQFVVYPVV